MLLPEETDCELPPRYDSTEVELLLYELSVLDTLLLLLFSIFPVEFTLASEEGRRYVVPVLSDCPVERFGLTTPVLCMTPEVPVLFSLLYELPSLLGVLPTLVPPICSMRGLFFTTPLDGPLLLLPGDL